jgi:hypothetical protein
MDGVKDSRKTQLGREVKNGGAAGTAVAATAVMRGQWSRSNDTPVTFPPENVGYLAELNRSYSPYVLGSIKQGPDPATFEQFPYLLAAAIRGISTGVADGAGSGRIYDYPWPTTVGSVERTATTIGFTTATKTIADSGNGLGYLKVGDQIQISGAAQGANNGIFTVQTVAAGSVTVAEAVTTEAAGASVTITVLTETYTIEDGNNALVERSAYSYPTGFELAGKGGANADALTLSATWVTRQWAALAAGFTAGIALPAVTEALFANSHLYIDDVGGTMGATEKVDTIAGFTYKAQTGLKHQFAGSGNLYFTGVKRKTKIQHALSIQLYQNAAAIAEYNAWLAHTPRLLRIRIDGPNLGTPGTTYSKKTILLNFPGTWSKFPSLDDIEGAEVLPGEFRPAYDPTAAIGPSITVVNELASLP